MILHGEITKFWTYRTAFVPGIIVLEMSEYDRLEIKNFLDNNGYKIDNHICWQMEDGVYCMYSDLKLHIAGTIEEMNW